MTCAHVVNVALKKIQGVEAVEVKLNAGLATVRLKPGNRVTVQQLWKLIHDNGYTPKTTVILARGEIKSAAGQVRLDVAGSGESLPLSPDGANPGAYQEAVRRAGQTATIRGTMEPGKDLKASVPLRVSELK